MINVILCLILKHQAQHTPCTRRALYQFYDLDNSSPYNTSTLVLIQIVQRHGDHAPFSFYPGDPYANDLWPDGLGELTPKGKRRMYNTGRQLRYRYGHWLGVSPKTIYQRSQGVDRCLESAYAVSAGMYAPEGRWVWDRGPTVPTTIDALLSASATCPTASTLQSQLANSPAATAYLAQNQAFIDQLNNVAMLNYSTLTQFENLYITLEDELDYPKAPPAWLRAMGVTRTMARLELFLYTLYNLFADNFELLQLRAGPLVGVLLSNMQTAISMATNTTMVK
ncbi:unnamed protein product, partial [Medioppia subpectinata]